MTDDEIEKLVEKKVAEAVKRPPRKR